MELFLVDTDSSLVEAWNRAFEEHREVTILHDDILNVAQNTIVSPANSRGFMDGGIDMAYLKYFGGNIQDRIIDEINRRPEEFLPVGASALIRTGNHQIPNMIIAPTMISPETVPKENAYRSFRAALRIAKQKLDGIESLYCPGMATGVGGVSANDAAAEMSEAYRDWKSAG